MFVRFVLLKEPGKVSYFVRIGGIFIICSVDNPTRLEDLRKNIFNMTVMMYAYFDKDIKHIYYFIYSPRFNYSNFSVVTNIILRINELGL